MRHALLGLAWLCIACRDESPLRSGLDQPVRVEDAFFREGELGVADDGPTITSLEATSSIALIGQAGRKLGGRADEDTWTIGLRFAELGTGWWIREVGDLAAQFPGERDLSLTYDVGAGIPPGIHALRIAAIDEHGKRGEPVDFDVCVLAAPVTAGLNPCDATIPPPALVITATWNRDVDLDLVVESPDGKLVRWKSPTTAEPENGVVPERALEDPTVGRLDHDSNAACIADGRNEESVTWEDAPAAGVYSAYVDLFDACGEADVTFTVVVYRSHASDDGTSRLEELTRSTGNLVAQFDAYGGAKPPLYVLSIELP
jgi:hypothetical protein